MMISDETGRLGRSVMFLQRGQCREAKDELSRCLSEEPEDHETHALLAVAIAQDPAIPELGRTQHHEQLLERALHAAQTAIELAPVDPLGFQAKAVVLMRCGEVSSARGALHEALRLNWEDPYTHGLLSRVELNAENHAQALQSARDGLAIDPDDPVCLECEAHAQSGLGNRTLAFGSAGTLIGSDPESFEAHLTLARLNFLHGDLSQAEDGFREALRISPDMIAPRIGLIETMAASADPIFRALYRLQSLIRIGAGERLLILGVTWTVALAIVARTVNPSHATDYGVLLTGYFAFIALTSNQFWISVFRLQFKPSSWKYLDAGFLCRAYVVTACFALAVVGWIAGTRVFDLQTGVALCWLPLFLSIQLSGVVSARNARKSRFLFSCAVLASYFPLQAIFFLADQKTLPFTWDVIGYGIVTFAILLMSRLTITRKHEGNPSDEVVTAENLNRAA